MVVVVVVEVVVVAAVVAAVVVIVVIRSVMMRVDGCEGRWRLLPVATCTAARLGAFALLCSLAGSLLATRRQGRVEKKKKKKDYI